MDRLEAMKTFVAVVECGGFASAARKLRLSPPVVTRAVADLEERLGLRLLTRTSRVVRVTEAGSRYAADCRRILAEIDAAEDSVIGSHGEPRGTLTLTAPVLFGHLYVTPVVASYLQRHPETDAQCWFVDRIVNILEEGIDVAVRISELPDSSLQATRVGWVRRVLVASPAYIEKHGEPRTPADLERHTLISSTGITPSPEWRFGRGRDQQVVRVHPRMRTTTNDSAITAAAAGLGIARLLSYPVAQHLRSGALKVVLERFEQAPVPIHVVHHQGKKPSRKVKAFLEMIVDALKSDPSLH